MKFKSYDNTVHADKCVWRESGRYNVYLVNIIRIFYEMGRGIITKVGKYLFELRQPLELTHPPPPDFDLVNI